MLIELCIDDKQYFSKPCDGEAKKINSRIASRANYYPLEYLADKVNSGYSFCPVVFNAARKCQSEFRSQQLFVLDFDYGIAIEDALQRAFYYHLNPTIVYETFSSRYGERFRFIFCHCTKVEDVKIARTIQLALAEIFPEADKSSKDIAKLYYGCQQGIYLKGEDTFDLYTLLTGMTKYFNESNGSTHLSRSVNRFAKATGLVLQNNYFKIDITTAILDGALPPGLIDNGNFVGSSIIIYMDNLTKLPLLCTVFFAGSTFQCKEDPVNVKVLRNKAIEKFKFDELNKRCKLFDEFREGKVRLSHMERFGIMTNLINVKGGQKIFLSIITSNQDDYDDKNKMEIDINYVVRNNYKPMACVKFCPYFQDCQHEENMLNTVNMSKNKVIKIKHDQIFISLEQVREELNHKFINVINETRCGIYVIKAQTGIGKTHTYLDFLEHSEKPCIVAVPTNKLKNEIYNKAKLMGLSIKMTPSIEDLKRNVPEINNDIEFLYSIGADGQVSAYIREWLKNNENKLVEGYINQTDKLFTSPSTHIITTHARYLNIKPEILNRYVNIIDEDIIKTVIQIDKVNVNDIKTALKDFDLSYDVRNKLFSIISNKNDYFNLESIKLEFQEIKQFIELTRGKISSNLIGALISTTFYYDKDEDVIYYIKNKGLDKSVKYVVLSATAEEMIYKKCFPEFYIKFFYCSKAQYVGKIFQDSSKTFSRTCIKKCGDIYLEITKRYGNKNSITFKNYNPYVREGDLHFGASEGSNTLEGKDLLIVGTPHMPQFVYKIWGLYLNINIVDSFCSREIEHNGYRFIFATYSNAELRKIQLWMISSELEQSIGRARLLTSEAVVYLFSNFPVEQAEFKSLLEK